MRIVAGKFKGCRLKAPDGIRPTKDMVKEALFNILAAEIKGASFLELFAGSGNVGIEAKSRGAQLVVLVENNRLCIQAIRSNLSQLDKYTLTSCGPKAKEEIRLLPMDAAEAVAFLGQNKQRFDLVFLDPPYSQNKSRHRLGPVRDNIKNTLIKINLCAILKPHSWVIAEHSKKEILPYPLTALRLMFTKRYGDSALSFYKQEAANEKTSDLSR